MREIVLDTETTGLDPSRGDRIVEIGCVELINLMPTGRSLQIYCNPEIPMPEEAFNVHGLSDQFLADKPVFAEIVDEFLNFVGDDSHLVIHNAGFDMKFINAELKALNKTPIPFSRAIDTVAMARQKFPGQPASLDALCRRFSIDLSVREKHGALLDSELLAEVYLELKGGRQPDFTLAGRDQDGPADATDANDVGEAARQHRDARPHSASADELAAHQTFLETLENSKWLEDKS